MRLQRNKIWHAGRLREVICQSPFDTNLQHKASLSHRNAMFIFHYTSLTDIVYNSPSAFSLSCNVSQTSFFCQRDCNLNEYLWTIKANETKHFFFLFFIKYSVFNERPEPIFFLRSFIRNNYQKYLYSSTDLLWISLAASSVFFFPFTSVCTSSSVHLLIPIQKPKLMFSLGPA